MVTEFYGVMKVWVGNNPSLPKNAQDRIKAIQDFIDRKNNSTLTKDELDRSHSFTASSATITALGGRLSIPKTLEDIFMLIHQNTIIAVTNLGVDISKVVTRQYPPLLYELEQEFNNNVKSESQKIIKPSTALELHNKSINITKNFPLRNHACIANIKYDIFNKTTSVNFSIFGDNGSDRWDNIVLDNYLSLALANCKFIKPPFFDKKKEIIDFEVQIDNKEQIKALIDEINKSINNSTAIYFGIYSHDDVVNNRSLLLTERMELVKSLYDSHPELQDKLNKTKIFPPLNITWQELSKIHNIYPNSTASELYNMSHELEKSNITFEQIKKIAGEEPKKIKAIIAEYEFMSRAFNNQVTIETIEKIDKWVNGDWEKGISGLMCLYEDFQKLGINDARIETLLAEPKNLSFLMKNISYIKEFSNVNLEQMNKWSGGDLESLQFIVKNYSKLKILEIVNVNLEQLNKWSGDNIQNMESLLNNVDIDKFKSLSKIGVKADTLDKWSEGKFENVKYLLDNIEGLKELSNLGITIEEIKQCEDLATIEALINSKDVLSFIEPTTISEIKKLAENDINKFTSLINYLNMNKYGKKYNRLYYQALIQTNQAGNARN